MDKQIITIVWDKNDAEPVVFSSGLPGSLEFYNDRISFMKKVITKYNGIEEENRKSVESNSIQVMAIVWNTTDDEPIITSSGLSESTLSFMEKTLQFLETKGKQLRKEHDEYASSRSRL